ncbi:ATP-binding protein [Phenylobacterium sp.]|uniref:ATP-binding protein n=1 Tax=Phenylobacterium sp. TaxID=1871053 RepID=UPI0030F3D9C3
MPTPKKLTLVKAPLSKNNVQLNRQKTYARGLEEQGFDFGLAVGSAFVESMRNTYYRHTGTALDELIDNCIEAGSSLVHVAFGYYGNSDAKPDAVAVIDNGHGMVPEMVRLSVLWGGTHREGSREGFGRFGFGLPSASVNQATRFSVYSIVEGGDWHGLTIDLDEIRAGDYTRGGKVVAPEVKPVSPPKWVLQYILKHFDGKPMSHGSVVVWDNMDRVKWRTTTAMTRNLLEHFGVHYRNYLSGTAIYVDGTPVEATDPLFITPGFRYFDEDRDRAISLEPAEFDVTSKKTGEKVRLRVRYARFPTSFFSVDKEKRAVKGNQNSRWAVSAANRGIIVCRMGRQIDVIEHTPWANLEKFGNDDRYWAAEIDFPAELDEEFTISNAKQGVVMSDRMWDILHDAGVEHAIRQLRRDVQASQQQKNSKEEGELRTSERSMVEGEKFRRKRAGGDSVEREQKALEALEQYVKDAARTQNQPEKQVREEFQEKAARHPYRVTFEDMPGAPFYRVDQIGGLKELRINRSHRFFSSVYSAPGATRFVRAGLEVLLFSIGECELDALGNPDKSMFYAVERAAWSEVLAASLEVMSRFIQETDILESSDDDADEGTETE